MTKMGIVQRLRERRFAKCFERVGVDCQFNATYLEIKGHVELGDRCILGNNVLLRTHRLGKITLGNDVSLGDHVLVAGNELVEIGDNTTVEAYAVLRDMNHTFHGTDVHWRLTPHQTSPIRIGKNCHIGTHSYIMPGVTMGDGAVIIPRSIIKKDVGPGEIWAGAPSAQLIGHRDGSSSLSALKRHADLLALYGFDPPAEAASGE
jgi:acetyltransferase-like isoleucine patch superfamily enzyme